MIKLERGSDYSSVIKYFERYGKSVKDVYDKLLSSEFPDLKTALATLEEKSPRFYLGDINIDPWNRPLDGENTLKELPIIIDTVQIQIILDERFYDDFMKAKYVDDKKKPTDSK